MRKKILEQQMTCDGWFTASHARVCRLHLAAYDHLTGQVAELDQLIAEAAAPFRRLSAGLVTIPGLPGSAAEPGRARLLGSRDARRRAVSEDRGRLAGVLDCHSRPRSHDFC